LPRLIHEVGQQAKTGKLTVKLTQQDLKQIEHSLQSHHRRTLRAITGATFFLSAVVLTYFDTANTLAGVPIVSWALGVSGALLLFSSFKRS